MPVRIRSLDPFRRHWSITTRNPAVFAPFRQCFDHHIGETDIGFDEVDLVLLFLRNDSPQLALGDYRLGDRRPYWVRTTNDPTQ